jgi:hypothetical protein
MSIFRRRRRSRLGLLAAGLVVLVAAALVVPRLLGREAGRERGAGAGDPAGPATASETPSPKKVFPGFWPAATFAGADAIQKEADEGYQPWRLDPRSVAERFSAEFVRWRKIQIVDSEVRGSASRGWGARVTLRPFIGEEDHLQLGNGHVMELVGLEGAKNPAWFVSALRSDQIVVEAPKQGAAISSPLELSGRGSGFEANLPVEIRNDEGASLHPQPGFVMGGAYEPGPFSGKLTFDSPGTAGGILIVTGDTGLGGSPPDWTIVRVAFGGV